MEYTQNTRKVLAAGLVLVAAAVGLVGCATASPAAAPGLNHTLVRESADHYVDQLVERAHAVVTNRSLAREDADRYVEALLERRGAVRFVPSDNDPRGHHVVRESLPTETHSVPSDNDPRGKHGLAWWEIAQLQQRLHILER